MPSNRQHLSSDDCPDDKKEEAVLCFIVVQTAYEQFFKFTVGLGFL